MHYNFNRYELCFICSKWISAQSQFFLQGILTIEITQEDTYNEGSWHSNMQSLPGKKSPHILEHARNLHIHSQHIFNNSGLASKAALSRKIHNILLTITGFRRVCPLVIPYIEQS